MNQDGCILTAFQQNKSHSIWRKLDSYTMKCIMTASWLPLPYYNHQSSINLIMNSSKIQRDACFECDTTSASASRLMPKSADFGYSPIIVTKRLVMVMVEVSSQLILSLTQIVISPIISRTMWRIGDTKHIKCSLRLVFFLMVM